MLPPGAQTAQVLGERQVDVINWQLTVGQYFIVQCLSLQEELNLLGQCLFERFKLVSR